jgi:hypothetical protein
VIGHKGRGQGQEEKRNKKEKQMNPPVDKRNTKNVYS